MIKKIELAVLPIPDLVFFPHTAVPLHLIEPVYINMIKDCIENKAPVGIALAIPVENTFHGRAYYSPRDVCGIGHPLILEEYADGTIKVLIKGFAKAKLRSIIQNLPYPIFHAELLPDKNNLSVIGESKIENLKDVLEDWLIGHVHDSLERDTISNNINSVHQIIDHISMFIIKDQDIKQVLLESDSLYERIQILNLLFPKGSTFGLEDPFISHAIKNYEILEKIAKVVH